MSRKKGPSIPTYLASYTTSEDYHLSQVELDES